MISTIEEDQNEVSTVNAEINTEAESPQNQRPQRERRMPTKYYDFEMGSDIEVIEEGELVHFALLEDAEPISHEEALQDQVWKNVMLEELNVIEKNNT